MFAEKSKQCEIGLGNSFTDEAKGNTSSGEDKLIWNREEERKRKGLNLKWHSHWHPPDSINAPNDMTKSEIITVPKTGTGNGPIDRS